MGVNKNSNSNQFLKCFSIDQVIMLAEQFANDQSDDFIFFPRDFIG